MIYDSAGTRAGRFTSTVLACFVSGDIFLVVFDAPCSTPLLLHKAKPLEPGQQRINAYTIVTHVDRNLGLQQRLVKARSQIQDGLPVNVNARGVCQIVGVTDMP